MIRRIRRVLAELRAIGDPFAVDIDWPEPEAPLAPGSLIVAPDQVAVDRTEGEGQRRA